ncbi:helix-turn-helix domain-containing protein [Embleya sp. NBC_00896]|uniref:helix-turn-helix domain-containing protein n=1 Tax=Embleya sp. NBC_00896 TaxID=2975961 RepID=UPI002F906D89|nr:hypothetical protein OG928_34015 [Embleya sp. NBC_00896]
MDPRRGSTTCGACGRRFPQRRTTGRKRLYCDPTCRRRAQKTREKQRGPATPLRAAGSEEIGIAGILRELACALEEAEKTREPLRVRLAYADRLTGETQRYRAVVGEARPTDTGTRPAPRWSAQLAARLGHRSRPGGDHTGDGGRAPSSQHAGERLAAALRELRRTAGITEAELAWRAGIGEAFTAQVLAGQVSPSWPVIETLTGNLGGDARELRALWECSRGVDHAGRRDLRDLALLLCAMLRGLRLAAGRPDLDRLGGDPLTPGLVERVLAGHLIPDRATTELLVERLGAHPDVAGRLWRHVHHGVLAGLDDAFPAGGLPLAALAALAAPPVPDREAGSGHDPERPAADAP